MSTVPLGEALIVALLVVLFVGIQYTKVPMGKLACAMVPAAPRAIPVALMTAPERLE